MITARAIKKNALRNTYRTIFGDRHLVTIRFPMRFFPEPYPYRDLSHLGDSDFVGEWHTTLPDGNVRNVKIHEVHTPPPEPNEEKGIYLIPGEVGEQGTYWRGVVEESTIPPHDPNFDWKTDFKVYPVAKDDVAAYAAMYNWEYNYVAGVRWPKKPISPALRLMLRSVALYCKRADLTYFPRHPQYAYVTFRIAVRRRDALLKFCKNMEQVLRLAEGMNLKLMRSPLTS